MTSVAVPPEDFPRWRTGSVERAEDAAYTFGYHLVLHCRDKALSTVPTDAAPEARAAAERAVDTALHNVMDMLEGFWRLRSGASHSVEYVLQVHVRDKSGVPVESIDLSPGKVDLPIGYWKWAHERKFK